MMSAAAPMQQKRRGRHRVSSFGSPTNPGGPVALRPWVTPGLPLSVWEETLYP